MKDILIRIETELKDHWISTIEGKYYMDENGNVFFKYINAANNLLLDQSDTANIFVVKDNKLSVNTSLSFDLIRDLINNYKQEEIK